MKVTKDGFVWLTVSNEKAIEIWDKAIFDLYILYGDDSESLIEKGAQLRNAIACGFQLGIEVGKLEGWVSKGKAIEAHENACPMINCVNCLFGVCTHDCDYQKEFITELNGKSND